MIDTMLNESRKWKSLLPKLDSGSYCENASDEYIAAFKIKKLYEELTDALINYERKGYKQPI